MNTRESELESLVIRQINGMKRQYAMWADPYKLAYDLEISVVEEKLGGDWEGAALAAMIVLDPTIGVQARRHFTFYHEITHHLIKNNAELLSILHDQYNAEEDHKRIIERLCNVGAAEFLIPRDSVLVAIETSGFSISLIKDLSKVGEVSLTLACVQLVQCAKHQCIAVVCRMIPNATVDEPSLFAQTRPDRVLSVETAISSTSTKYTVSRGSLIPKGHILFDVYEANSGRISRAKAPIPFRHRRGWEVECEAMRLGTQVFGLFHVDSPPVHSRDQLQLPFAMG